MGSGEEIRPWDGQRGPGEGGLGEEGRPWGRAIPQRAKGLTWRSSIEVSAQAVALAATNRRSL